MSKLFTGLKVAAAVFGFIVIVGNLVQIDNSIKTGVKNNMILAGYDPLTGQLIRPERTKIFDDIVP